MKHRSREEAVGEFYTAAGMEQVEFGNNTTSGLHLDLIEEEYDELMLAATDVMYEVENGASREDMIKELADLQYVISGFAWRHGINLEVAFNRVHASNMTKVVNGKVIRREDGKILKPETYRAPDMSGL